MGRSLTSNHIFNAEKLTKAQFKKKFTDMMKAKGYTSAKADDGEISYALAFSGDRSWVTVLTEESTDTRKEAAGLAKNLGLQVLSAELVDSDFAELTLYEKSGAAVDTIFLGEPYFEEYPEPSPLKWQTLLGIDWTKVEEIQQGDYTFADDALCEFGEVIGCENMLLEFDGVDDDAVRLYFKKAWEKKLTLNAAFKKYFGEILEPLGFVYKVISKRQFFIRVINNEIIQTVTYHKCPVHKIGYNNFFIEYSIYPMYCKTAIRPDSLNEIFANTHGMDIYAYGKTDKNFDLLGWEFIKKVYKTNHDFWADERLDWSIYSDEEAHKLIDDDRKNGGHWTSIRSLQFSPDYLDQLELAVECAKKLILSEFEKMSDLNSLIEYYYENCIFCLESIEFEEFSKFGNHGNISLMPIVAGYNKDITQYVEKAIEQERQKLINKSTFKHYGEDADRLRNRLMEEFKERMDKMLAVHDKILNTPELKERALQMAEEFRQNNLGVLRSYGLKI